MILSRALRDGDRSRGSSAREQALVLLNRRGFATAVFCRQCAGTLDCPNCSVSLVVHGEGSAPPGALPLLQLLGARPDDVPAVRRPVSRAGRLRHRAGRGARCARRFPARASRGSIATRSAARARSPRCSARFRSGEIDVLVGTQMIAKGHDFPRVTLVGVVSADVGLGLADFRASERTFQLLTQVAGRAGRGEQAGEAIVQTLYPDHYSIQLACRQDYPAFYERELQFRRAMRYPPLVSLVNVVVRGAHLCRRDGRCGGRRAAAAGVGDRRGACACSGPAPAPLGKLRGEYRAQLLVKGSESQADARGAAGGARRAPRSQRRRIDRRRRSAHRCCDDCRVVSSSSSMSSVGSIGAGVKHSDEHDDARTSASTQARAIERHVLVEQRAGAAGRRRSSMTTIRHGPDDPAAGEEGQHRSPTPIGDERDVASTGGRAPRRKCGRRRAGRSGNRFSAVASSPNHAANAIGCMFSE